jgi:hypothetical protein
MVVEINILIEKKMLGVMERKNWKKKIMELIIIYKVKNRKKIRKKL